MFTMQMEMESVTNGQTYAEYPLVLPKDWSIFTHHRRSLLSMETSSPKTSSWTAPTSPTSLILAYIFCWILLLAKKCLKVQQLRVTRHLSSSKWRMLVWRVIYIALVWSCWNCFQERSLSMSTLLLMRISICQTSWEMQSLDTELLIYTTLPFFSETAEKIVFQSQKNSFSKFFNLLWLVAPLHPQSDLT